MTDENLHHAAENTLAWELRNLLHLQFTICFQYDLGQLTLFWVSVSLLIK